MKKTSMSFRLWLDHMYVTLLAETGSGVYSYDTEGMEDELNKMSEVDNKQKKTDISKKILEDGK